MFLRSLLLGVCGVSAGLLASGGVFTVLVSVGLISRFAGKTHTASKVLLYEEMVCFGTIVGCLVSVFPKSFALGEWILSGEVFPEKIWIGIGYVLLCMFGIFAGIFIGCLALAIAELLDVIPIFTRRIKFRYGVGILILAMAIGKMVGSILYFSQSLFHVAG